MYTIFTIIFIQTLFIINGDSATDPSENISINNITEVFINLLNVNSSKVDELRDKLGTINKYVIDNDKYFSLLKNITQETKLNETNFYKSLNEEDHFRFLVEEEPKSLYLKLKERITRDDVFNILAKIDYDEVKTARKAMRRDMFGDMDEDTMDEVVDKLIAHVPTDKHRYSKGINDSKYWDPQKELEELRDYHQHDGRRIYRGERTTVRYYPFMVSIHVMGRFWCGGVVYWNDLVLTSASCLQLMHNNRFFRENPKVLSVRVGSNHSRIGGEMIDALEVYFHPGYSPKTLRNNIAVIRLRRHLMFTDHRIPKLIEISHNGDGIPSTAEVLLLGWGVTKMSQKLSYEPIFLQRKFLPIYPNKFCKEIYGDKFITSTMFCAGTFTTGEGACDHDAGGPAILSGRLVGVISFGPALCGFNAPTVFTLVGAFADWIETVNETMPPYHRGKKRTTTTTESHLKELVHNWADHPLTSLEEQSPAPQLVPRAVSAVPPAKEPAHTLKMQEEDTDDGWSIMI